MNRIIIMLAFRNLREHKRKSLTVGLIVATASLLFVTGSSLLESATIGLRKTYRDRFTGDLYVTARSTKSITAFGWGDPGDMGESLPLLPRHDEVKAFAATLPGVESLASRSVSFVQVSREDSSVRGATLLMGIDPIEYEHTFPEAFILKDGEGFSAEGEGMLASSSLIEGMGKQASPGSPVLLSTVGAGSSIRAEEVRGGLPGDGANPFLDMTSYVRIDVLRGLLGQYEGSLNPGTMDGIDPAVIDEDELFGGSAVVGILGEGLDASSLIASLAGAGGSRPDPAAWHALVIKVRSPREVAGVRAALEGYFTETGIEAQTRDWLEGAGMLAATVMAIKQVFYYVCGLIGIVALLVIMNALVISVTERTGEIGTMRAVGASRRFVNRLIVMETMILSLAAGITGSITGSLLVGLLAIQGIPADGFLMKAMFGGPVLRPFLDPAAVIAGLLAVVGIGAVASWYPTQVALRISPVTAMNKV